MWVKTSSVLIFYLTVSLSCIVLLVVKNKKQSFFLKKWPFLSSPHICEYCQCSYESFQKKEISCCPHCGLYNKNNDYE